MNDKKGNNKGDQKKKKTKDDFVIPYEVKEKYPDLIELILRTESMNDEERQYWFSIMPAMNDEQIARLREILEEEKRKLAELDKKYEEELRKIAEKHFLAKTSKERKENWEKVQKEKEISKKADEEEIDNILSELENLS